MRKFYEGKCCAVMTEIMLKLHGCGMFFRDSIEKADFLCAAAITVAALFLCGQSVLGRIGSKLFCFHYAENHV